MKNIHKPTEKFLVVLFFNVLRFHFFYNAKDLHSQQAIDKKKCCTKLRNFKKNSQNLTSLTNNANGVEKSFHSF